MAPRIAQGRDVLDDGRRRRKIDLPDRSAEPGAELRKRAVPVRPRRGDLVADALELELDARDLDGTTLAGFDPAATGYGTGVQGMIDRLAALGGTLTVRSAPGEGTTVEGALPVAAVSSTPTSVQP